MHPVPVGLQRAIRTAASVLPLAAVAAAAAVPAARASSPCPAIDLPSPSGLVWRDRLPELRRLARWHGRGGAVWRLTPAGVAVCAGRLPTGRAVAYRVERIARVWRSYGPLIAQAAREHAVPAELIVAVIVNESGGRADAIATYRGFAGDARTPSRVSIGLGQMLLSTARAIMNDRSIDRAWLLEPRNAIRAIAVYIDRQYRVTGFDPPLVAAAYNAGALYRDPSPANPWRLRSHRVGRLVYIDYFVAVANAATVHLRGTGRPPAESFAALLARKVPRPRPRPACFLICLD